MSQLDEGSQASQLDDDFQASNDASMGSTASGMTEQLELLPSDATNPDASAQQHSSPNASTSGTPDTILSRVEQISGTISQHCRGVPRKAREAMRAQYSSSNDDDPLGGDWTHRRAAVFAMSWPAFVMRPLSSAEPTRAWTTPSAYRSRSNR